MTDAIPPTFNFQTCETIISNERPNSFSVGKDAYIVNTTTNYLLNSSSSFNSHKIKVQKVQTNNLPKSQGNEGHLSLWYEYSCKLEEIKTKLPLISNDYDLNLNEDDISNVIDIGMAVLDKIISANLASIFISPTAEGGVLFKYTHNLKKYVFEVYPNSEIVYLTGQTDEVGKARLIELSELDDLLKQLDK